ncbi:MAG: chromophore lyase CpcT/CpeT [Pseudomonadota bacterium]
MTYRCLTETPCPSVSLSRGASPVNGGGEQEAAPVMEGFLMVRIFIMTSVCCALSACAHKHAAAPQADIAAFAALMADTFETAPDDPKNNFRDRRFAITAPELEGTWLYYQLNTGPQKQLYRQRVIQLSLTADGEGVLQSTYALKGPEKYVDAWQTPGVLEALTPEDIDPYFDKGCGQVWRPDGSGWRGYVDPATCRVFSERRQSYISIEAEAWLDDRNYWQAERGFDANGNQLFGTEPGEFIELFRQ